MQHMHQPWLTNDMIHFILSCELYWFIDLDLTYSSPLLRSIGAKSLLKLSCHVVYRSKAPTFPSHLQLVRQAKPHLDLLHLVTWLLSCLICNEFLHHMCKLCNISKPFLPSWHMLLALVYLWTNHLCISHKDILVHLGCHSITKTKQKSFSGAGWFSWIFPWNHRL
jgi:hypothetical protein